MADKIRIVHYINEFFAGIGVRGRAPRRWTSAKDRRDPGWGITQAIGAEMEIVRTIWCGDNLVNQEQERILQGIEKLVREAKPDLVVAGPGFECRPLRACLRHGGEALHGETVRARHHRAVPREPRGGDLSQGRLHLSLRRNCGGHRKDLPGFARLALKPGRTGSSIRPSLTATFPGATATTSTSPRTPPYAPSRCSPEGSPGRAP